MEETKTQNDKGHALFWESPQTGKRFNAGRAFFLEKYGEYILRIDEKPEHHQYYLKPVESVDGKIRFRVEQVKNINNKFYKRLMVGDGESSETTDGTVYIDLGSAGKLLVLEFNPEGKKAELCAA